MSREILTIGKVCWEVREAIEGRADWDLVVVDAAATGHVIAQLGAADAIRDLVAVGPVRGQTEWMSELLADPAITALNVVTTPEEMPIEETIDLVGRARTELDVPLGAVIVNRVLPELFTRRDEALFSRLREPSGRDALVGAVGPGVDAVIAAADLAVAMRRSRVDPARAAPGRGRSPDALPAVPVRAVPGPARDRDGRHRARRGAGPVSPVGRSIEALLATKEIVVFCGSGGVGKTSVAASSGVAAATRMDGKVLVVTVDPAKRLADALGIEGIGNVERRVPDDAFAGRRASSRAASCGRRCSTPSRAGTRS